MPRKVKIAFHEVTFLRAELDLDYKTVCGDAIASSRCEERSELMSTIEKTRLADEPRALESYLHFVVELCPPSGVLDVFARDFSVYDWRSNGEVGG